MFLYIISKILSHKIFKYHYNKKKNLVYQTLGI